MKSHFEEEDINKGLINRVAQFSGKYRSFGSGFKWIEKVGFFFLNFMKWLPLQLQGSMSLNYLYLNYAWEMTLKQTRFELGLLIIHAFLSQLFNTTDNLKATRTTHWFLVNIQVNHILTIRSISHCVDISYVFLYLIFRPFIL